MKIRPKIFLGIVIVSGIASGILTYFKSEYVFFTVSTFAAGMIGLAALPESDYEKEQNPKHKYKEVN